MFRHVLVAFDAAEPASRAFDIAVELAARTGARVTVLSVAQVSQFVETVNEVVDTTEAARGALSAAVRRLLAIAEAKGVRLETRRPHPRPPQKPQPRPAG